MQYHKCFHHYSCDMYCNHSPNEVHVMHLIKILKIIIWQSIIEFHILASLFLIPFNSWGPHGTIGTRHVVQALASTLATVLVTKIIS